MIEVMMRCRPVDRSLAADWIIVLTSSIDT